jgi:hypothetical protein
VTILEQLEAADALLTPETWCQRTMARDTDGICCPPISHAAKQWCAWGAICKVTGWMQYGNDGSYEQLSKAAQTLYECNTPSVINDTLGFDAVKAVYAEAIRRERERGK